MFRNSLNLTLNPESIFLLQNGPALAGISPLGASLAATRQWSFYFRLSKQIRWGAGLPSETPGQATVPPATLMGTLEGVVLVKALAGPRGAPGITVSLDGGRTAVSGADGHYVFENVPEGEHQAALSLAELPADFDPGEARAARVAVQPHRTARADFEVLPLMSIAGHVSAPPGVPLADILVRMAPGDRYTTTSEDGSFTFYNVREGAVVLALDTASLPAGAVLLSPGRIAASLRDGTPAPPMEFTFEIHTTQKPVRKVLQLN